jgi:hypothetical protein
MQFDQRSYHRDMVHVFTSAAPRCALDPLRPRTRPRVVRVILAVYLGAHVAKGERHEIAAVAGEAERSWSSTSGPEGKHHNLAEEPAERRVGQGSGPSGKTPEDVLTLATYWK